MSDLDGVELQILKGTEGLHFFKVEVDFENILAHFSI